jgi:hypothetical protein
MAKAEQKAREAKIGLWQMGNAIASWDYRNKRKHTNSF